MFTTFRELDIWKRAMQLVDEVYDLVERLPRPEQFILLPQMLRSAISIPSNIAEGHARLHRGDYVHHLSIARGSLAELETQLEIGLRRGYFSEIALRAPLSSSTAVAQMLYRLLKSLTKK